MAERKPTRIQAKNRAKILEAALDVFARDGFRGATVDAIAAAAEMSKPNLLYYYPSKDWIYRTVLESLLETWLDPLRAIDASGNPATEIAAYIERKIELARDFPRESRLFANEMLRGAPILGDVLTDQLKPLVDEKAEVIRQWTAAGKLAPVDPRHLLFTIWSTTQHYADFDVQVRAVLDMDGEGRFHDASAAVKAIVLNGVLPR